MRSIAQALAASTVGVLLLGGAASGQLAPPVEGELSPEWLPDSAQIAFRSGSTGGVNVVDVRTRKVTPFLPSGPVPVWSPDGREFLTTQTQPAPPPEPRPCGYQHPEALCIPGCPIPLRSVFVRTPNTHHDCWTQTEILVAGREAEPINLTNTDRASESFPAWSPDGSTIAYTRDSTIWTMARDGSGPRQVAGAYGWGPAWSRDGKTIAFSANGAIWTVDAVGGEPQRLVSGNFYALYPSWSPDSRIVYSHEPGTGALVTVIESDGSGARHLTQGNDPTWSPDGRWIAFVGRVRDRLNAIYVIRPDGAGLTRVTGPAISPDVSDPACTKAGKPGGDTVAGTAGRDFVCALAGNDVVRSGAGRDTVLGGPGRDRLIPGAGADEVDGGEGGDDIFGFDVARERDVIRCGKGRDVVRADRSDDVAADCERVFRR